MNVLLVAQYFPPDLGGAAIRAYNVAKGLLMNGCDVTVVAAFPHYPYGETPKEYRWKPLKVEWMGKIRVIRTFVPPMRSQGFFRRLVLIGVFAITSLFAFPWVGKTDAIWASSWIPGLIYGRIRRRPVALNVDDLRLEDIVDLGLINRNSLIIKIAEQVYRLLYVSGDVIEPIGAGYVDTISNKYGVERNKIHVIRSGVDLAIFRKSGAHNHSRGRFLVLYTGVLGVGYDFDQVLRAARILEEKGMDVEFTLHGGGESLGYVRNRIKELHLVNVHLSDKVLGSRREVVELLSEADALILPLKDFGRPYLGIAAKLYEYQAMEKPIICCADGQPAEYIRGTYSGIIVKPGDHEALAQAVIYLKENPNVAQEMAEKGRKYAESNLSVEIIGSRVRNIFEELSDASVQNDNNNDQH